MSRSKADTKLDISTWAQTGFWPETKESVQENKTPETSESEAIISETNQDSSCEGDILDGSCEGDILDPPSVDGRYYVDLSNIMIMPEVVDIDSECGSDILDKLATYKVPDHTYQNVEIPVAANNHSPNILHYTDADTTKSSDCRDSIYEYNKIVSKNENFESSVSSNGSESTIFPTSKRKMSLKLNYDSSDSVDTKVYIKENQKITEIKSRNKKKLVIPYKLYNNGEKSKVNPHHEESDQNDNNPSINKNCMDKSSIDDDNISTVASSKDESSTTIVKPAPLDIGNNDLDSFLNNSVYSEDFLDRSIDDSHLITIVMPATENVDSECETDILEVDYPEINNGYGSTIESSIAQSDDSDPTFREMMLNEIQTDDRNTGVLDSSSENNYLENTSVINGNAAELPTWEEVDSEHCDSDDYEDVTSFYAIPFDPNADYNNLVDQFSAFKTFDEFFGGN